MIFVLGSFRNFYLPKPFVVTSIKIFQFSGIFSGPILFTCNVIRNWFLPCTPYAVGFGFLKECFVYTGKSDHAFGLEGFSAFVYWSALCLLFYWALLKPGAGFYFYAIQLCLLKACCLRYYLKNLLNGIKNITMARNKCFINRAVQFYKELQIMCIMYNQIQQDIVILALLYISGVAIVLGLYALITSWQVMTFLQLLVLISSTVLGFSVLVFCFGNLGGIYVDSMRILDCFKREIYSTHYSSDRYWSRKHKRSVDSLQPLKIKFGSVNFVDKLTPILFLEFSVGILVNLLIVH